MRETPRPQGTVGDTGTEPPQPRLGRALAHTPGVTGSGTPHRSDGRPPQTPRGVRKHRSDRPPRNYPPCSGAADHFPLPARFVLCALLFALITWQVIADGPLRDADERLGPWITGSRLPDGAAEFLADLAGSPSPSPSSPPPSPTRAGAATGPAPTAGGWPRRPRPWPWPRSRLLVIPLKELIGRTGPPGMDGSGYYPSGHTATAMVAYGGAALLLLPFVRGTYARRELVIACGLLNFGGGARAGAPRVSLAAGRGGQLVPVRDGAPGDAARRGAVRPRHDESDPDSGSGTGPGPAQPK